MTSCTTVKSGIILNIHEGVNGRAECEVCTMELYATIKGKEILFKFFFDSTGVCTQILALLGRHFTN